MDKSSVVAMVGLVVFFGGWIALARWRFKTARGWAARTWTVMWTGLVAMLAAGAIGNAIDPPPPERRAAGQQSALQGAAQPVRQAAAKDALPSVTEISLGLTLEDYQARWNGLAKYLKSPLRLHPHVEEKDGHRGFVVSMRDDMKIVGAIDGQGRLQSVALLQAAGGSTSSADIMAAVVCTLAASVADVDPKEVAREPVAMMSDAAAQLDKDHFQIERKINGVRLSMAAAPGVAAVYAASPESLPAEAWAEALSE